MSWLEDAHVRYPSIICCISLGVFCRCVSIFPDQKGFAVGSIEGRVGIEYFSEQAAKAQAGGYKPVTYGAAKQSFAFKCHRVTVSSRPRHGAPIALLVERGGGAFAMCHLHTAAFRELEYATVVSTAPVVPARLPAVRARLFVAARSGCFVMRFNLMVHFSVGRRFRRNERIAFYKVCAVAILILCKM